MWLLECTPCGYLCECGHSCDGILHVCDLTRVRAHPLYGRYVAEEPAEAAAGALMLALLAAVAVALCVWQRRKLHATVVHLEREIEISREAREGPMGPPVRLAVWGGMAPAEHRHPNVPRGRHARWRQ